MMCKKFYVNFFSLPKRAAVLLSGASVKVRARAHSGFSESDSQRQTGREWGCPEARITLWELLSEHFSKRLTLRKKRICSVDGDLVGWWEVPREAGSRVHQQHNLRKKGGSRVLLRTNSRVVSWGTTSRVVLLQTTTSCWCWARWPRILAMMDKLPILFMAVTMGPFVTIRTVGTVTKSASGTLVMLAAMGGRVGGRNNYLRFQRGDQGPDREGGRAGAGVAPGQIILRLYDLAKKRTCWESIFLQWLTLNTITYYVP